VQGPTTTSSNDLAAPLLGFRSPSEYGRAPSRRIDPHECGTSAAPPMRFAAPTASPRTEQRLQMTRVCLARVGLRLQVFSTSWRLPPPRTCWPCFVPDPLMGFTLQSLAPLAQPYAVSSAAPLLALGLPAETHGRNGDGREPKRAPDPQRPCVGNRGASPVFRVLLHARVRHQNGGGLDRRRRVALLGFLPSRVFSPAGMGAVLHHASPHVVLRAGANDRNGSTPGCCFRRDRLASLEAADPPGVSRLVT
jgi:hypothetical protein